MHPAIFFQITLRQPAHARLMDIIFEAGGTGFIWYGRVAPPRRKTSRKSLNHSSPFFLKRLSWTLAPCNPTDALQTRRTTKCPQHLHDFGACGVFPSPCVVLWKGAVGKGLFVSRFLSLFPHISSKYFGWPRSPKILLREAL